jgi:hypothetical protein
MGCYKIGELHKLAEGQGYGTAYEYLVKLRLLERFTRGKRIKTVLIYGLPEKYGLSLDFFYFCQKKGYKAYLLGEKSRTERLNQALDRLEMQRPREANLKHYDLILSSEYIQNLSNDVRKACAEKIKKMTGNAIIFVPNRENKAHAKYTGLSGLKAEGLAGLFNSDTFGWIDAPFFPPGIKLKQARNSRFLLWLLVAWSWAEWLLPMRRKLSHICYAIL